MVDAAAQPAGVARAHGARLDVRHLTHYFALKAASLAVLDGVVAVEVPRPRHHDDLRFHDLRRRVLHLLGIDCECGPSLASCPDITPEAGLSGAARQTADHSAGVSADFSWS